VDLPEELPKKLEMADRREVGKRRGIADDDHGPSRRRSVSRSCSKSSTVK
jgi:hypothetical protein